jgi:hypothetical protein
MVSQWRARQHGRLRYCWNSGDPAPHLHGRPGRNDHVCSDQEVIDHPYPIVVGGGTPFLPPVTEGVSLDLIERRTFGTPVIY